MTFKDLLAPTAQLLKKTVEDLLDRIVISDSSVTRREEQLDQLCNLLLLKLESDKEGKSRQTEPVFFRPMESVNKTATTIKKGMSNSSNSTLRYSLPTKIRLSALAMKLSPPAWK